MIHPSHAHPRTGRDSAGKSRVGDKSPGGALTRLVNGDRRLGGHDMSHWLAVAGARAILSWHDVQTPACAAIRDSWDKFRGVARRGRRGGNRSTADALSRLVHGRWGDMGRGAVDAVYAVHTGLRQDRHATCRRSSIS